MKRFKSIFPDYVRNLLLRLLIVLGLLTLTRIVFYIYNVSAFQDVGIAEFFWGAWFDLITISLYFLPYYALFLLPINIRHLRWHQRLFKYSFHGLTAFMVTLNLIDCAYFPYTLKRSTADILTSISTGSDFGQLFTTFLGENWPLIIVLIGSIFLTAWLYRKTELPRERSNLSREEFLKMNWIWLAILLPLFIFIGRGGIRPRPISILDASAYTTAQNASLVLNTPLAFLKTFWVDQIEEKNYMSLAEERALFNPIHSSVPANILPDSTNVVILVLESFGKEFVGTLSGKTTYTPFLDSLLGESLYYEYAFANGKKSNEAIPAILASIPSLYAEPYMSSRYSANRLEALPTILKEIGYSSAFYHGATNGSMMFDRFSEQCGFDHYFGRKEYGNDRHFDGTWAISDAYFNPWAAKQMSRLKPPFLGLLFTTSSHHPYVVPKEFQKFTKKGNQPICRSISYSDYALRLFFEEAKKQPWFANTLFVLVADHSPASQTPQYSLRHEMYRIPIGFYHPKGLIKPKKSDQIAQQLDIFPTILDFLNVKKTYYSYGSSLLQPTDKYGIAHLEGSYYYFNVEEMLIFCNERVQKLFNFTHGGILNSGNLHNYEQLVSEREKKLKAIIQRYSRDLISNETRLK